MSAKKALDIYRKKRNFRKSPEPVGGKGAKGKRPIFVIQKHAASRLHYDFRLEVDGVLKSWAVPKGPSTDPRDKRLAVQVEDHPLDYADFEGTIPEDEYGGGSVIVWDAGSYRNLMGEKEEPLTMAESIKQGHVEVWLEGEKLRGGYALIQTKMRGDPRNWLLMKLKDEEADARRNPVSTQPKSVLSGKTVEDISKGKK